MGAAAQVRHKTDTVWNRLATVRLENVSKDFGAGTMALDRVNLEIADGELMVVVGPSGCGKTTMLRLIAGLERPSQGWITIGDRIVNDVSPKDRQVAMVFQNYALYPHLSVLQNLAFALKFRRCPRAEIEARVKEVAAMLGLENLLERKPAALSGASASALRSAERWRNGRVCSCSMSP